MKRGFPLLWVSLVYGCSSVEPVRPPDDFAPVAALTHAAFPGATNVLDGFAPDDDDAALRVGDAALLGIEFRRGEGIQRQLLLMEVVGLRGVLMKVGEKQVVTRHTTSFTLTTTSTGRAPAQKTLLVHDVDVRLRRFDADGTELTSSIARLYEEPLRVGWWADVDSESSETDGALASLLTFSLQNLATGDPTLQELLFLLVDKPSLLSIATHFGVHVNITNQRRTHQAGLPHLLDLPHDPEVRVAPMDLDINGTKALWADLLVVRPTGALSVCGGLVGAIARHPTEPGRGAVARLLATRRGVE